MFYQNILIFVLVLVLLINVIITIPQNDKALFDDDTFESRRRHQRPCRGRNNEDGRTFLDWSFQHIDVDYNYNYNINCGGIGGSGDKPQRPHRPHFQGGLFGQNHQQGGLLGQHLQNRPPHNEGNHRPPFGDKYSNRPGQYLIASNPLFGDYVHDLSNFDINPNKIIRQFNRGVRKVIRPLTHLLRR